MHLLVYCWLGSCGDFPVHILTITTAPSPHPLALLILLPKAMKEWVIGTWEKQDGLSN